MGIIGWVAIGALAGWIASMITKNNKKMGIFANIIVGIIGGFFGGLVMNWAGDYGITGFNIRSLIIATVGSVILLLVVNAFRRGEKSQTSSN